MGEPKRKAREKRAVGADPLAGLDGDRLAGLLGGRSVPGDPLTAPPVPAEPKRKKRRGPGVRGSAEAEELELALGVPREPLPLEESDPVPVRPGRKGARLGPKRSPEPPAVAPQIEAASTTPSDPAPEAAPIPARDPTDPESVVAVARAHVAAGRPAQAVALLERSLQGPARSAVVAVELGRAHVRAGAFNEAEEALQRAIRLDPESGDAHLELGILRSKKGLYAGAVDALREALVLQGDPARSHYYLGICLNQLDRIDEARSAFESAVEADATFDRAWYQLGIVWDRKGDLDRARDMYRRAREVAGGARG